MKVRFVLPNWFIKLKKEFKKKRKSGKTTENTEQTNSLISINSVPSVFLGIIMISVVAIVLIYILSTLSSSITGDPSLNNTALSNSTINIESALSSFGPGIPAMAGIIFLMGVGIIVWNFSRTSEVQYL